jgi:multidrug resistance efflux pump
MSKILKYLTTGAVVLAAIGMFAYKYWDYVTNPWTRNGKVRANVVQITPRVSGPIVKLPVRDNQLVQAGDLLFEIDPRTFIAERDRTAARLDRTRDDIKALEKQVKAARASLDQYESRITQAKIAIKGHIANVTEAQATYERIKVLVPKGAAPAQSLDDTKAALDIAQSRLEKAEQRLVEATAAKVQAQADFAKAEADLGVSGEQNARLREAAAIKERAELDLEFTQIRAPVNGYVTNLNLRLGDQAVTNQPALALVDVDSFWVHGFFKETLIEQIRPGDSAIVTLMGYSDKPLEGRVDSIGRGIAQEDGSTGFQLLPNISPTFEWIRLAQRVPIRIELLSVPENVELIVGTTASVLVMTGTAGQSRGQPVAAIPQALQ